MVKFPKIKILGTENGWRNEFGEQNKIQQLFASYVSKLYVEFIEFLLPQMCDDQIIFPNVSVA